MAYTSYYLYQKYEQRGGQDPIPAYPNYWSVDGDGTMPLVKKMDNDPSCGYVPPVTAIYRWVNIDITKDYVCDECPKKFQATYSGGKTYSAACDSSTELTTSETEPVGYEYSAMTSAVIGDCVTSIGDAAFIICVSLASVSIPNSVTSIGTRAFRNCRSLSSIVIPDSVTSIGESAFKYCNRLTSINIPSGITRIDNHVFQSCYSLAGINIPSGVTSIGDAAFEDCISLANINIPSGVTSIGNAAFAYCTGLTSCTIGSGVTSIDDSAFFNCFNLTSVTIPSSVTSIGTSAFQGCSSLASITVNKATPPTLGANVFDYTNDAPIYVPSSSVNAYKTASGWSTYASRIQAIN